MPGDEGGLVAQRAMSRLECKCPSIAHLVWLAIKASVLILVEVLSFTLWAFAVFYIIRTINPVMARERVCQAPVGVLVWYQFFS